MHRSEKKLREEITRLQMDRVKHYARADRVAAWIRTEKRMPANLAFTAGPERDIAYAVEELIEKLTMRTGGQNG